MSTSNIYGPERPSQNGVSFNYEVKSLGSKSRLKEVPFEKGGGYRINYGGDGYFQYHPKEYSHHGGAYWKVKNGRKGGRYGLDGNPTKY